MFDMFALDRTIDYGGIIYQVIEVLKSDMLLVVEKAVFDRREFPMPTFIIPGQ
ncbi:hypothetical protein M2444_005357 [Paenibacillus sp. PastF-3]|uniref:hypothetical protein n=1 Tax=Paenibacillus sp. PastF-3 TaxID=2940626 RepID=UPI0024736DC1|nr:hypothetical protein [Paenibacillus sp. PastF-3]MDH6373525.1 hypothetical protein [Paenibacillus sp. PastF-3]